MTYSLISYRKTLLCMAIGIIITMISKLLINRTKLSGRQSLSYLLILVCDPISQLSSISKTFEKVVFNQVYAYFTNKDLFYNSQYGFRKLHSTEYASLEMVDCISQYLDNGKLPITVYLDLSKAFDTINHEILLKKIKYYGFADTPLKWFESYLHNRQQHVFFNGCYSTPKTLETGVPQGSILEPLLFLIYMNDLKETCNRFFPVLYADDTGLVSSLCSFLHDEDVSNTCEISRNINDELYCVQEWLNVNRLSLNVSKTKYWFSIIVSEKLMSSFLTSE